MVGCGFWWNQRPEVVVPGVEKRRIASVIIAGNSDITYQNIWSQPTPSGGLPQCPWGLP